MDKMRVKKNRQFAFQCLCAHLGAYAGFLFALTRLYPAQVVLATEVEILFWFKFVLLCSLGGPGMLIVFGPLIVLREVKQLEKYKNTYALGGVTLFAVSAVLTFFINPLP